MQENVAATCLLLIFVGSNEAKIDVVGLAATCCQIRELSYTVIHGWFLSYCFCDCSFFLGGAFTSQRYKNA